MKLKKSLAFIFALLLFVAACTVPLCSSAVLTTSGGTVTVMPGNTRSSNPQYNYAWLDTVILRDDALAVTPSAMTPKADYPYSLTLDEFISESRQYMVLFDLDVDSVNDVFLQILQTVYYTVIALGLSDSDYQVMANYLTNYGINYTSSKSDLNVIYTTILYSCIKNDAYYVLYGKHITIPKGITLEHAIVIYLAEALNINLPSGVNTLSGLSLLVMRGYITDADLPISANPDKYEAYYWAKIAVAAAQDYKVPTIAFNEATQAQRDYVDYAYCSSVIKLKYDVTVNPLKLCTAMNSNENYAVQKLILKTMLDEKSVTYSKSATVQQLFEAACKAGYFALDDEFYTDIFNYDVSVGLDCEKLWMSPFGLAGQLNGGTLDSLSIAINGTPVSHGSTTGITLDKSKSVQTVTLTTKYFDGIRNETATYTFNVRRSSTPSKPSTAGDIVGTIESYISSAIPEDNLGAQERVSEAFDSVRDSIGSLTQSDGNNSSGVISTYAVTSAPYTASQNGSQASTQSSGSIFTTYPIDSTKSSTLYSERFTTYPVEQPTSSFSNALSIIAKNPVATATPISLIAVGTAVGLIMNKRRKENEERFDDRDDDKDNYTE